jgi:hypothetical protein
MLTDNKSIRVSSRVSLSNLIFRTVSLSVNLIDVGIGVFSKLSGVLTRFLNFNNRTNKFVLSGGRRKGFD